MRTARLLVLPVLLLSILGCGIASGIQQIQSAATQLPAMLTAAPTALGPLETAAAQYTPDVAMTPSVDHLGIPLSRPQQVMNLTQEFAFAPGTVDGKPAVLATLTTTGEATFKKLKGSIVQFIGDPNNLSRIVVIAPSGDSETNDEASGLATLVIGSSLSPDAKFDFITWFSSQYQAVQDSGQQQTVIKGIQITMKIDQGKFVVELVPAPK